MANRHAALTWQKALRDAGRPKTRIALYLINIANVNAGGFAESKDFGGCGALGRFKVLHHELGHALDIEDLNEEVLFPYRGAMHGIDKTTSAGYHIGPTWGFRPADRTAWRGGRQAVSNYANRPRKHPARCAGRVERQSLHGRRRPGSGAGHSAQDL
jgi:hypothetical protein